MRLALLLSMLLPLAVLAQSTSVKITDPADMTKQAGVTNSGGVRGLNVYCIGASCAGGGAPDGGVIGYMRMPDGGALEVYTVNSSSGGGWVPDGGPIGTVEVSNFPATQPVSIASMPSTPVTGAFWQATQPVSIASPVTQGPSADGGVPWLVGVNDKDSTEGSISTVLGVSTTWTSAWIDTLGYGHMDIAIAWQAGGNASGTLGIWWSPDAVSLNGLESVAAGAATISHGAKYEVATKLRYAQVFVTNGSGTFPLTLQVNTTLRVLPGAAGATLSSQAVQVSLSSSLAVKDDFLSVLSAGSSTTGTRQTPCIDTLGAPQVVGVFSVVPGTLMGYTDSSCATTGAKLRWEQPGIDSVAALYSQSLVGSSFSYPYVVDMRGHRYFRMLPVGSPNFSYRVTAGGGVPTYQRTSAQVVGSDGVAVHGSQELPNLNGTFSVLHTRNTPRVIGNLFMGGTTSVPFFDGGTSNPTQLVPEFPTYADATCFYNDGPGTIYFGPFAVTPSIGIPLPMGAYWCDDRMGQKYFATSDVTSTLRWLEF